MKASEKTRKRMSKAQKQRWKKEIQLKQKFSICFRGNGNPNWRSGKSFEPYSTDWTEDLKRAIRKRDKYTCQLCGKEPSTHCHHIDYDKKNCNPNNLIILCHSCHMKTSYNRDYWIKYFQEEIISQNIQHLSDILTKENAIPVYCVYQIQPRQKEGYLVKDLMMIPNTPNKDELEKKIIEWVLECTSKLKIKIAKESTTTITNNTSTTATHNPKIEKRDINKEGRVVASET